MDPELKLFLMGFSVGFALAFVILMGIYAIKEMGE